MSFKTKYTEEQEKAVYDLHAKGYIFKQICAELNLPLATAYRLLEKATKKWGFPKEVEA